MKCGALTYVKDLRNVYVVFHVNRSFERGPTDIVSFTVIYFSTTTVNIYIFPLTSHNYGDKRDGESLVIDRVLLTCFPFSLNIQIYSFYKHNVHINHAG